MIFKDCTCAACGEVFDAEPEGGHRLMCGDATDAADAAAVLDGVVPTLMVTDPPYGVDYDPKWRDAKGDAGGMNRFAAGVALGTVRGDDQVDWSKALAHFRGSVAYVWFASNKVVAVGLSLESLGYDLRYMIVWNKHNHAIGRGDYHWKHEPCWYAVRRGAKSNWQGARDQMTVWDIKNINPVGGGGQGLDLKLGHGTQKPVECMRRPIANNTRKGDVVYDPFAGSGTTIIAAQMMERTARAIEIDPGYVDVGVRRWQDYAKAPAVLALGGATFDKVASSRRRSKK